MKFPRTYKKFINEWYSKLLADKSVIVTVRQNAMNSSKSVTVVTRYDALNLKFCTKVYRNINLVNHPEVFRTEKEQEKDYSVQAYIKFLCNTTNSYPGFHEGLTRIVNGTPRFRDLRKGMTVKLEYNSLKMTYMSMSFPNKAYKFFIPSKNKEIYLDVRQFRNREVYSVDGFFGNTVPKEKKIDDMYMPVCKSVEDVMKELTE